MMMSSRRDRSAENLNSHYRTNSLLTSYRPYSYTYMALLPNVGSRVNEAARRRSL